MGHDHDGARIWWAFSGMKHLATAPHYVMLKSFGLELELETNLELELELEINLELRLEIVDGS